MLESYALLKLLKAMLANPMESDSLRGMARKAKLSPSRTKVCLDYLANMQMLKIESMGRMKRYVVDLDMPLARQWKILFSLEELQKIRLVEKIRDKLRSVSAIILYGSMAMGTDDEKSDVDLLVIARDGGRIAFPQLEARLGREITILVQTPSEWREKAKKDKVFYERVMLDSIPLYGRKPVVL